MALFGGDNKKNPKFEFKTVTERTSVSYLVDSPDVFCEQFLIEIKTEIDKAALPGCESAILPFDTGSSGLFYKNLETTPMVIVTETSNNFKFRRHAYRAQAFGNMVVCWHFMLFAMPTIESCDTLAKYEVAEAWRALGEIVFDRVRDRVVDKAIYAKK